MGCLSNVTFGLTHFVFLFLLAELCQSYPRTAWDGLLPTTAHSAAFPPGTPGAIRSQLLTTTLWTTVFDTVDQLSSYAQARIQTASQLQRTVIDTMQKHIREMESMRKELVDQGMELNRQLQDVYTEYRRAKQEYASAQKGAEECVDALSKAQLRADKKKDVDKLQARAQAAVERVEKSAEMLKMCEETRGVAQQEFFEKKIPAFHNVCIAILVTSTLLSCLIV